MRLVRFCVVSLLVNATGSIRADEPAAGIEKKPESQRGAAEVVEAAQVKFSCIVVDSETGNGIPDAKIEVLISIGSVMPPGPMDIEPLHVLKRSTDASGKYEFSLSRELLSKPGLLVRIKAERNGYISGTFGSQNPLPGILSTLNQGNRPPFEKTTMRPGDEVTGVVADPSGRPLEGIRVEAQSVAIKENRRSAHTTLARTNDQGRFRLFVPKESESQITIIPRDYAFSKRFIGKNRGDIGEIQLENGVRIAGILLDVDRRPVVGVPVNIALAPARDVDGIPLSRTFRRGEYTGREGRFSFSPLPPGEYHVTVDDQIQDTLKEDHPKAVQVPAIFVRQTVVVAKDKDIGALEIQAIPHVFVRVQFYDAQKNKIQGVNFTIAGTIDGQPWSVQRGGDPSGTYELKVPHGLERARLQFTPGQETIFKYRCGSEQLIRGHSFMLNELGTFSDDSSLAVFLYTSATVEVTAVNDKGEAIPELIVRGTYNASTPADVSAVVTFTRKSDGRYESRSMLPEEDVTVSVGAVGYSSVEEKLNLKDGETKSLKVTLTKEK